ncbi:MAG: hypothetical protein WB766_12515 [Roseiarcus sp.]
MMALLGRVGCSGRAPDEALPGVGMAVFLNNLNRWVSAELDQEEAAELLG